MPHFLARGSRQRGCLIGGPAVTMWCFIFPGGTWEEWKRQLNSCKRLCRSECCASVSCFLTSISTLMLWALSPGSTVFISPVMTEMLCCGAHVAKRKPWCRVNGDELVFMTWSTIVLLSLTAATNRWFGVASVSSCSTNTSEVGQFFVPHCQKSTILTR